MITLRLVVDLNIEQYGTRNDVLLQRLRDLISHAEGDGLLTGSTDAELVECVHDCFEIHPGDFANFDPCRTILTEESSPLAAAGSAAGNDLLPSCGESVAIAVQDVGSASTPAPISKSVVNTGELPAIAGGIRATLHSDDYAYDITFNAVPWFADASDEEIEALADVGWGGDRPADEVAIGLEEHYPEVATVLDYCRGKEECGYEVHVNEEDAKAWLRERRPKLLESLLIKENE